MSFLIMTMETTGNKIDVSLQNISAISPNYPLIQVLRAGVHIGPKDI
jgi:hypothetical protein